MRRTLPLLLLTLSAVLSACTDFEVDDSPTSLSLNKKSVSLSSFDEESFSLVIRNGDIWSVGSIPDWISVNSIGSSSSSRYEWVIDMKAAANYSYDRNGIVTFTSGSMSESVLVSQIGIKGPFNSVQSISFVQSELTVAKGDHFQLSYEIYPNDASDQAVNWESSSPTVATVQFGGYVEAIAPGVTTIIATTRDQKKTATCKLTVSDTSYSISTPDAVDLGLPSGIKWASFNLGATKPEDSGLYYAWGETEPYYSSLSPLKWKEDKSAGYESPSYKWCTQTQKLTKYCTNSSWGNNGFIDRKTILDPADDAAHVKLGGNWRMPTEEEWIELYNKCTISWTSQGGKKGFKVTSRANGKSIFLPAAGFFSGTELKSVESVGVHWSSSLGSVDSYHAYGFAGNSSLVNYRWAGQPIRPVTQ